MNTPPSAWLAYFESGFGADGNSLSELGATSEFSFPGESRTQFTPPTIAHRNEAAKPADLPAMQATKLNGRSPILAGFVAKLSSERARPLAVKRKVLPLARK
jgi:hypothetical protein